MNTNEPKHLPLALFLLRVSVFVVFLIWTLDKFLRPEHAAGVYQNFYFSPALSAAVFYALGTIEMMIIVAFLLGIKKKLSYGAVFLFHLISTVSTYKQFFAPFENMNILFYAALPMLAACFALYVLRDHDTMLVWPAKPKAGPSFGGKQKSGGV